MNSRSPDFSLSSVTQSCPTAACQASLSLTVSWGLLKLMSTESLRNSAHCCSALSRVPLCDPMDGSTPVLLYLPYPSRSLRSLIKLRILKWGHLRFEVDSTQWLVTLRGNREGDSDAEERPCRDRGRNWSDAATSQGTPRASSRHLKLGKRHEREPPRGYQPCLHWDFRPLASRTTREKNSVVYMR